MKYRIVSRLLVAGRTTFQRGQVVDGAMFPPHRIGSLLRLGMIEQVTDTVKDTVKDTRTVADLKAAAAEQGIDVPKGAKKQDIIRLLAS